MNTPVQSPAQTSRSVLIPLVLFHLIVIAASNYLVQIPIKVFGYESTWGAFTFPLIFLATDLTVRIYGAAQARRIIFAVMLPALIISYIFSVIFYEGNFQGFKPLAELNTFVARIAIASLIAYTVGQLLDVIVFNKLRKNNLQKDRSQKPNGNDLNKWWVAPAVSTLIGGAIDTILFFSIAFYQSTDKFMADNWAEIATVDYAFKLIISILLFVPAYGFFMNRFASRMKE